MYTRRRIIKFAAATPLILSATPVLGSSDTMKDRIAQIIREYSQQGIHRSGTAATWKMLPGFLSRSRPSGWSQS